MSKVYMYRAEVESQGKKHAHVFESELEVSIDELEQVIKTLEVDLKIHRLEEIKFSEPKDTEEKYNINCPAEWGDQILMDPSLQMRDAIRHMIEISTDTWDQFDKPQKIYDEANYTLHVNLSGS